MKDFRLVRDKSKWLVVDIGNRVRSTHKTRTAAAVALGLLDAYQSLANGWERCTPCQRGLLEADVERRKRQREEKHP